MFVKWSRRRRRRRGHRRVHLRRNKYGQKSSEKCWWARAFIDSPHIFLNIECVCVSVAHIALWELMGIYFILLQNILCRFSTQYGASISATLPFYIALSSVGRLDGQTDGRTVGRSFGRLLVCCDAPCCRYSDIVDYFVRPYNTARHTFRIVYKI